MVFYFVNNCSEFVKFVTEHLATDYLDNVTAELATFGVTEEDLGPVRAAAAGMKLLSCY